MANFNLLPIASRSAYTLASSLEDSSNSSANSIIDSGSIGSRTPVVSEAETVECGEDNALSSSPTFPFLGSLNDVCIDDASLKLNDPMHAPSGSLKDIASSSTPTFASIEDSRQGWWWLELSSVLLSLASTIAMAGLLLGYQQKPLHSWPWSIQINSVIAILTTVGRTSFMVAVSSAISQLKWEHFQGRSHPLDHFEAFDGASRGPLGSLRLIWTTRARSILASLGALVTILSLAVGPFAQQILEFPTRTVGVTDQKYALSIARVWDPIAYNRLLHSDGSFSVRMQASIANAVLASPDPPAYFCPENATKCEWRDFTTLALCTSCRELAPSDYKKSCTKQAQSCIYSFGLSTYGPKFSLRMNYMPTNDRSRSTASNSAVWFPTDIGYVLNPANFSDAETLSIRNLDFSLSAQNHSEASSYEPDVNVVHCQWKYCLRRYSMFRSTSGRVEQAYDEEPISDRKFMIWKSTNDGSLNYSLQLTSASTGEMYEILSSDADSHGVLYLIMTQVFKFTMEFFPIGPPPYRQWGSWLGQDMSLSHFNENFTIPSLAERVSAAVSAYMRRPDYNADVLPTVAGQAFVQQTYIQVRWAWLILPLFETVLSTILLVLTIVITRDRPLWKNSALAVMLHGYREEPQNEMDTQDLGPQKSLTDLRKKLLVTLNKDKGNKLRLMQDP